MALIGTSLHFGKSIIYPEGGIDSPRLALCKQEGLGQDAKPEDKQLKELRHILF